MHVYATLRFATILVIRVHDGVRAVIAIEDYVRSHYGILQNDIPINYNCLRNRQYSKGRTRIPIDSKASSFVTVRISLDQKKEDPIMHKYDDGPATDSKEQHETSAKSKQEGEASALDQFRDGPHLSNSYSSLPNSYSSQEASALDQFRDGPHLPNSYSSQEASAPNMRSIFDVNYPLPLPDESELQRQTFVQQEAESGLTTFFESVRSRSSESNPDPLINWSNKTLAPALLSAALKPIIRVVEAATYDASAIYKKLKLINPSLQEDTVNKLVKLLKELSQGKPLDEESLRIAIWELLSDKQANEDLKQVFIGLKQTIQEAQAKTRIDIRGNVYGLIIGDHNVVHQTFNGFLQDKP
jgi:hypothetical protein